MVIVGWLRRHNASNLHALGPINATNVLTNWAYQSISPHAVDTKEHSAAFWWSLAYTIACFIRGWAVNFPVRRASTRPPNSELLHAERQLSAPNSSAGYEISSKGYDQCPFFKSRVGRCWWGQQNQRRRPTESNETVNIFYFPIRTYFDEIGLCSLRYYWCTKDHLCVLKLKPCYRCVIDQFLTKLCSTRTKTTTSVPLLLFSYLQI